MKCDDCKQAEATVHVSRTINGQSESRHWCEVCAKKHPEWLDWGPASGLGSAAESGHNFFQQAWPTHFLDGGLASLLEQNLPALDRRQGSTCPTCGTGLEQVRRTGMLGCPDCYDQFRSVLDEIFSRLQRGDQHRGRRPGVIFKAEIAADPNVADTATAAKPLAETSAAQTGAAGSETVPATDQVAGLKQAIQKAVAAEDYLEAARLRDELRALTTEGKPAAKTDGQQPGAQTGSEAQTGEEGKA